MVRDEGGQVQDLASSSRCPHIHVRADWAWSGPGTLRQFVHNVSAGRQIAAYHLVICHIETRILPAVH